MSNDEVSKRLQGWNDVGFVHLTPAYTAVLFPSPVSAGRLAGAEAALAACPDAMNMESGAGLSSFVRT